MDISGGDHAEREALLRLESFLVQDPDNMSLRTAIFEAALRCADWNLARAQIDFGLRHAPESMVWRIREGDLLLAKKDYRQAREVLQALGHDALPAEAQDTLLHNVAYTYFGESNFDQCVAILEPRMAKLLQGELSAHPPNEAEVGLQKLWLRALHHSKDAARACAWAKAMDEAGELSHRVAGIASLAALDASETVLAQKWSRIALESDIKESERSEAIVTRASLLLASRDTEQACKLADRALMLSPREGRAWSIRGFAKMLDGALAEAQAHFYTALETLPGHIGTWHGLGWSQLLAGLLQEALATFQHALDLDRNFAESQGAVAVALFLTGDAVGAKKHADNALRLDKNCLAGQYAAALISGELQSAQALQRLAKRILGAHQGPLGGTMADWIHRP
ncbi:hypothetical protein LJR129_004127 [Acidovorax sp. LjRoot129]|uniref:tetratricopeptide repeat protein n=1 Tax=Acidovorax sp. LjRoot129 TaxID=3342260 RepID=UPI003ED0874F